MEVFDCEGEYLPSKLAHELSEAGIPVLGVTCTEKGDPAVVVAVQIITDDGVGTKTVDKVIQAHDPTPEEPEE